MRKRRRGGSAPKAKVSAREVVDSWAEFAQAFEDFQRYGFGTPDHDMLDLFDKALKHSQDYYGG